MISLSRRVTLASALVLTVFIGLTALALEQAFEQSARSAMRERLFAQLYLVMAAAEVSDSGMLMMPGHLAEARLELPGSGLYARISKPSGEVRWHSPSALGLELPPHPANAGEHESFSRLSINDGDYFLAALGVEWETIDGNVPLNFSVMEDSASFTQQMSRYRRTLWGWLGAMALLSLLALLGALAWGLRPLRTVAAEVSAIESGTQQRLERNYPRELQRLTDNINTLLRHERAQQERYKNALGDLAHSLKTPLAVLHGLTEGQSEHSRSLREQIARMDNIVQYRLQRAATAGRRALAPPLALRPTLERLLASLRKVYRDKGVEVELALQPGVVFHGDEGDLMELLGNLLDNAFKWSAGTVRISAQGGRDGLRLTVEDDGPGIDEAHAAAVLQRGVRLDEETPGHGIGLPIVREIVAAYGGRLVITRAELGGAALHLHLPNG
ncbi:MAG: ATP-binding protein [Gammaproteobacteria bacterium]|nr:ATP-binding protein [Gammaproteobacteria bacterium]